MAKNATVQLAVTNATLTDPVSLKKYMTSCTPFHDPYM